MQSTASTPYIRTVDSAPLGGTCLSLSRLPTKGSQIVPCYVPAGIEVCVELKPAPLTYKMCLVSPVLSGYIPAPATPLRSVSRIRIHNPYPFSLCLILYKPLKLCKVPAVYPTSVPLACLCSLPYTLKLLKNQYPTSRNELHYLLSYLVVYASPKPFLPLRELLKVPLCRGSAFGLQAFSESLIPLRYTSDVSTIKEPVDFSIWSRNNRKFSKTQINSHLEILSFHIFKFFFNANVEEKLFTLFVVFEVSVGNLPIKVLFEVLRDFYLKLLSSFGGSEGDFFSIQPEGIGAFVVSDSGITALGALALETFSLSFDGGFEAFGSDNSCGDYELGREGSFVSNSLVGELMEFNTIPELSRPAYFAGVVIGKFVLLKGFKEYAFLFFGRFKNKLDGSLQYHIHTLSSIFADIQKRSPPTPYGMDLRPQGGVRMKPKDISAMTVGLNLLGGIIAGLIVGYFVDYSMEEWFGLKTSPWGLIIFFFIGIISGFRNAYRDMKRLEG